MIFQQTNRTAGYTRGPIRTQRQTSMVRPTVLGLDSNEEADRLRYVVVRSYVCHIAAAL